MSPEEGPGQEAKPSWRRDTGMLQHSNTEVIPKPYIAGSADLCIPSLKVLGRDFCFCRYDITIIPVHNFRCQEASAGNG